MVRQFVPLLLAWATRNAANIIFTLGLASITVGAFLAWTPAGFIVPGTLICGIMVWHRQRQQPEGSDDA
jgi:hypothetical protein